jgi:hypothetical protein
MRENHLTWSVANWITVFLMFLSAWIVLSLAIAAIKGRKSGTAGMQRSA